MIALRVLIALVIFILIILNTIYPAFKKDLPLFWMFRKNKFYRKYRNDFREIQDIKDEQEVINKLNNLKRTLTDEKE